MTIGRITAIVVVTAAALFAQEPAQETLRKQLEYTRAHYTKYDYRIPMRDGVKLFTSVYVPKDFSQPYPILMQRTPYSVAPYGIDNYRPIVGPSELFTKEGFIFASLALKCSGTRSDGGVEAWATYQRYLNA